MQECGQAILGLSAAMSGLRGKLPKIGRSDAPALITGSTGTGKEFVARALHLSGNRDRKPFIAINCAAIPDSLFEAELFGFERGSFTGALHAQKGKAVLADGGTLFLDEIGELPLFSQSKLLRMLEEREAHPIGSARPVKIDVRIIAATNRNIEHSIELGAFRSDLYYRLNVARVAIPDLAERPEDIPVYVEHFIDVFNHRMQMHVSGPDPQLMDILMHYPWPGNVREVRNFVEAVFIDPPERAIGIGDIPESFVQLRRSYVRSGEEEQQRILSALEKSNWNKVEAARILKWSRMTLYRKLNKYDFFTAGPPQGPVHEE